jgi:hypothetical protein
MPKNVDFLCGLMQCQWGCVEKQGYKFSCLHISASSSFPGSLLLSDICFWLLKIPRGFCLIHYASLFIYLLI